MNLQKGQSMPSAPPFTTSDVHYIHGCLLFFSGKRARIHRVISKCASGAFHRCQRCKKDLSIKISPLKFLSDHVACMKSPAENFCTSRASV